MKFDSFFRDCQILNPKMQFQKIIGLNQTKQTLIKAVQNNHLAHAQLFHGNEGSANLAMSIAFATYVNCEDKQPDDSCGRCPSCLKMSKLAHPDITYIYPTAGGKTEISENFMPQWREFLSNHHFGNISDWLEKINKKQPNIPVEEARQLLQKLSLKSYEGGYKIVIIWQAEYLHTATANALLKILEEPPDQTLFLLVCNSIERLLTTIISRTQRVAIRNFTDDEVINYLIQKQATSSDRAKQIAYLSEGNLSKALSIINHEGDSEHQWFANWMRMCYATKIDKLVPMADEFDGMIKEKQKGILEYGLSMFREIILYKNGAEKLIRLEGEELTFVQKFGGFLKDKSLEPIIQTLSDAYAHIERNVRAKMIFLDISLMIRK
jgi:DNA polymerase III subunit delta'